MTPREHEAALEEVPSPLAPPSPVKLPVLVPVVSASRTSCLIIYTGGTFGMTPDSAGVLHPTSGFLATKIASMDEFDFPNMPSTTVLEWDEPIDSSDMNPKDWKRLATQIHEHYLDYDGFVILQGTDTMAYTASALSFMLEKLGKPVVLAGAMIPLHFPHSDARRNLIMSVLCAATLDILEVCIYSNDKLLRGNRTTKQANMSVDAFFSPNHQILASTGVETVVDHSIVLPHPRKRFGVFTDMHTDVCVFHLVPGFNDDCIRGYIEQHEERSNNQTQTSVTRRGRAVVFSLYGTGNAPLRKGEFLSIVERAVRAGIMVVVKSQCAYGRTKLDSYATGVRMIDIGVISSFDMTVEACVTKLAYLMGLGIEGAELKQKMETNLRGELSRVEKYSDTLSSSGSSKHLASFF